MLAAFLIFVGPAQADERGAADIAGTTWTEHGDALAVMLRELSVEVGTVHDGAGFTGFYVLDDAGMIELVARGDESLQHLQPVCGIEGRPTILFSNGAEGNAPTAWADFLAFAEAQGGYVTISSDLNAFQRLMVYLLTGVHGVKLDLRPRQTEAQMAEFLARKGPRFAVAPEEAMRRIGAEVPVHPLAVLSDEPIEGVGAPSLSDEALGYPFIAPRRFAAVLVEKNTDPALVALARDACARSERAAMTPEEVMHAVGQLEKLTLAVLR